MDTQSTSAGSRFLDACRHYNSGTINPNELVATTALLGFNNVIVAFHVVGNGDVEARFFHDERQQSLHGIRFTDELLVLASETDSKTPRRPRPNPGDVWSRAPGTSADLPAPISGLSTTTDPTR